ncbi:MAG TPA: ammonia channel protein, partial [Nitrospiraceae bacterium]|nr:ammonia channel protein [Nitrospiraceae bacterium]
MKVQLWKLRGGWSMAVGFAAALIPAAAGAEPPTTGIVNATDTAWVLISSVFVLAMILPGLALFYGGLVRSKNVLGTIMQSFVILCLVSVLWMLLGYSLAFGPDKRGIIGGLEWVGLQDVDLVPHPVYAPTIPHQAFMIFQLMFAAITPALITGAFAERMRFSALVLFAALWSILVY